MSIYDLKGLRESAAAVGFKGTDEELILEYSRRTKTDPVDNARYFGYDLGGKWGNRASASIDSYQAGLYGVAESVTGSDWARRGRMENEAAADLRRGIAREQGAISSYQDIDSVGDFLDYAGGLAVNISPPVAVIAVPAAIVWFSRRRQRIAMSEQQTSLRGDRMPGQSSGYWDWDGSIARVPFFARLVVFLLVYWLALMAGQAAQEGVGDPSQGPSFGPLALGVLLQLALLPAVVQRLNHIGWSRWLAALGFVPLLGGVLNLLLVMVPGARHKAVQEPDLKGALKVASEAQEPGVAQVAAKGDAPITGVQDSSDALYAQALDEVDAGLQERALWARALAATDGSTDRAKAEYIKLRVQRLEAKSGGA
ncbi:DUF805 domain-containing protein [Inhella sp.]|uniref:DUF805 domain-containing protein n=1 Tax=Inhella sp. TaxID=1921806 RepID=UPI0035B0E3E1